MKKYFLLLIAASIGLSACRKEPVVNEDPNCPPLKEVSLLPRDDAWMTSLDLSGTCLSLGVGASGGCAEHAFELAWDGSLLKTLPPQAVLYLHHESNGDMCESIISRTVDHDLGRILDGNDSEVILRVVDPSGNSRSVTYRP